MIKKFTKRVQEGTDHTKKVDPLFSLPMWFG